MKQLIYTLVLAISVVACGNTNTESKSAANETPAPVSVPTFNADSAYNYVASQVAFGPRVPNTEQHQACADWLSAELKRHGAVVTEQKAKVYTYDKKELNAINIIGSYNPESKKRILLCAHWDTRPFADEDKNKENHHTAIDGANDGASGVGVLLEMARLMGEKAPDTGVDIIFFDAEDWGTPKFDKSGYTEDDWCLGSQYWAKNPHVRNYKANFGILLDMVGAPNATFYKEGYSMQYAPTYVNKVWDKAAELGYGNYFSQAEGGYITDDHYYVNTIRKIPTIDIIQYSPYTSSGFGDYWHTVNDTMDNIDKNTLKAVGQTVTNIVYEH